MKKKILLSCTILALVVSCFANRPIAKDVGPALNAAQLACVFSSSLTDSAALAKLCGVVDKLDVLLPLVQDLIGQREGARKAGVSWGPRDAGSDARAEASVQNDR